MLLKIYALFKTIIKFYEHRLFMVWAVFLFFFLMTENHVFFKERSNLNFIHPLKVENELF